MLKRAIVGLRLACVGVTALTPPLMAQEQTSSPVKEEQSAYTINPGDDLQVYVWGDERLQQNVKVLPDGTIAFPLIGTLMAKGNTPAELETRITEGLSSQYKGKVPQVTVSVVKPAGLQITIMGKVNSPGVFSPGRSVNVIEALALAGGPAAYANLKDILVLRKVGTGIQTYRLNVKAIFSGKGKKLDLNSLQILQNGDLILVP